MPLMSLCMVLQSCVPGFVSLHLTYPTSAYQLARQALQGLGAHKMRCQASDYLSH